MPRLKDSAKGLSSPRSRSSRLISGGQLGNGMEEKETPLEKPEKKSDNTSRKCEIEEDTSGEEVVRRSGRQRTVSSRLQDAHFLYSGSKQTRKRTVSVQNEESAKKPKGEIAKKPKPMIESSSKIDSAEDVAKPEPVVTLKEETKRGGKISVQPGVKHNKSMKTDISAPTVDIGAKEAEFISLLDTLATPERSENVTSEEPKGSDAKQERSQAPRSEKSEVRMANTVKVVSGKTTENKKKSADKVVEIDNSNVKQQKNVEDSDIKTKVPGTKSTVARALVGDKSSGITMSDNLKNEDKTSKGVDAKSLKVQGTSNIQKDTEDLKLRKAEEVAIVVKNTSSENLDAVEVEASKAETHLSSTPSIRIKTVNSANLDEAITQEQQDAPKVVMHLPGGVIHLSEDQAVGVDLVQLLGKGNAQVTEVQQLPGGMICYSVQEPEEDHGEINQDTEKGKLAASNNLQTLTIPGTDKLGLLGPVLNMQGLLECPYCEYTTDKKTNWYKHKKKHSGIRRYECDKCSYKAATSSNLKRHYAIHMDLRQFMCDICKKLFRQKIHLERHIKYKHEMKQIKCSLCSYVCSNYNPDLKLHMKRQHQVDDDVTSHEKLMCKQCGFIGATKKDVRQHMKFHRSGPEVKLFCEQCSFITDCESRLARHMLTHTNEKPFACGLCNYKASQREHVVRHMITVHKVQPEKSTKGRKRKMQETECFVEEQNPMDVTTESHTAVEAVATDDPAGVMEASKYPAQEANIATIATSMKETHDSQSGIKGSDEVTVEKCDEVTESHEHVGEGDSENMEQQNMSIDEKESKRDSFTEVAIKVTVKQSSGSDNKSELQEEGKEDDQLHQQFVDGVNQPASVRSLEVLPMINQKGELSIFSRKVRLPATYTNPNREKLFACMHCTMKFAKAINLYKHLKIQHKDMQPAEEGYYGCVLCEYKSNKRKNLLVHLRKHNAWPQETPEYYYPHRVYSCLLCDYKDTIRKRLYEHWRKQHKLQIVLRSDGTAKCIMSDKGNGEVEVTELDEDNEGPLQIEIGGDVHQQLVVPADQLGAPGATVMQVPAESQATGERLNNMVYVPSTNNQGVSSDPDSAGVHKTVMLMMEPGMPPTPVQINLPGQSNTASSTTPSEADLLSDAAESLQALAGVVESAAAVEPITAAELLEQTQQVASENENQVVSSEPGETVKSENQGVSEGKTNSEVHLTSEQLMNLEAGDYIEINGETYKVEFQMESQSL